MIWHNICQIILLTEFRGEPFTWLSVRKKPGSYKDYWNTPGGRIELSESPLVASARELREETGLSIALSRFRLLSPRTQHINPDGGNAYSVEWFYLESNPMEIPSNTEPHKHSDWVMTHPNALKGLKLLPGTLEKLRQIKKEAPHMLWSKFIC